MPMEAASSGDGKVISTGLFDVDVAESAMMVSAGRRCTAAVAVLLDQWHGGKGARKANDGSTSTSTTTIKHNMITPEHSI